ncbi:MAG: tryptophan synthase subunit alpha [Bacteroidetes bacterium]|nr:tryptophan synthase subunit alpha [Bacteroidota bacterium]
MNKLNTLFREKKNILSIYFTAGFPKLDDTNFILSELEKSGADMIEIGIPFSDPLADGPTIQHSSEVALRNGMNLQLLFQQLPTANCQLPTLLMGYLNPVLQFGMENFCRKANEVGISGVILPDLPMDEYLSKYKNTFEKYNLKNIFLITPQTSDARIKMIDKHSDGFIYMVSSASTTGTKMGIDSEKEKFFQRIKKMKLKNPVMIGFGISDMESFSRACKYANGAIIGSAFIKHLESGAEVKKFISGIK